MKQPGTDLDLTAAIRRADFVEVARLVGALTPQQRRAELPALKALRRDLRESERSRGGAWTALLVAGAVCHTAPSGAAEWIGSPDFDGIERWQRPPLSGLLDDQDAGWQRDVALRLARRPADREWWGPSTAYRVAEHLLRASDTLPPAEPGFVAAWMTDRGDPRPRYGEGQLPAGVDLYARLVQDNFTPVLAPLVFDADTVQQLSGPWAARQDSQRWPAVLARLAAERVIDRGELIARGFARLVRGGGAGELRGYLAAVRELAPSVDELAANLRALTALLDGPSTLAGYAQECLIALDRAGRLDDATVAEAADVLLTRPEKKLVRAQLAWLDRVAARAPELALRAAARCYANPDRQLQEQALKLTERHLSDRRGPLLLELRTAALLLDPAHAVLATQLLGLGVESGETAAEHDRLPEPPRPEAMPAPLGTPAEVAEELAAAMNADGDSVAFERVLDGLVRHAWRDRAALTAALAPVLTATAERRPLGVLAGAVTGALPKQRAWRALSTPKASPFRTWDLRGGIGAFIAARLEETAWRLSGDPVPLLLATPTRRDGALDPAELAARLRQYEELGLEPGPLDLAQALLRTMPDGRSASGAGDRPTAPGGAAATATATAGADRPVGRGGSSDAAGVDLPVGRGGSSGAAVGGCAGGRGGSSGTAADGLAGSEGLSGEAAVGLPPGPFSGPADRLAGSEGLPGEAAASLRPGPADCPADRLADRLAGPAGARLAAWLRVGGLPRQASVPVPAGSGRGGLWMSEGHRFCEQVGLGEETLALLGVPGSGAPGVRPEGGVPEAVRRLLGPSERFLRRSEVEYSMPDARWLAVLPHHREELAARLIGQLADSAGSAPVRGHPQVLPLLAETGGPAGFAVHQALAYGLGAAFPEDRTAVVDALLSLAAQSELDAELLGREAGELLRLGAVKANRLAATCTEFADAGAPRLAWAVLSGVLPAVLDGRPPAGAAGLLTAAVECARRAGASGPIPAVTAVAASGARSKLVAEAKVLAGLLEGT
ncbi:hypothetical protein ACIQF6_04075 [Kitasatospora sp. NPDC092948]|uniref:hypothetical protein n=1 Tax=Kitasatospora sp. NPDC092948 TaxID=3364088 RepID=UPI0037F24A0A